MIIFDRKKADAAEKVIDSYSDQANIVVTRNSNGSMWFSVDNSDIFMIIKITIS
jgi:hypothetical protein